MENRWAKPLVAIDFLGIHDCARLKMLDKIRTTRKVVAMKGIAIKLEKVDFGVVGLKFIFVRQVNDSIHRKREKKKKKHQNNNFRMEGVLMAVFSSLPTTVYVESICG